MTVGTITMTMIWVVCAILWSLLLGMEIMKQKPSRLIVISDSALIVLFCVNILMQLMTVII